MCRKGKKLQGKQVFNFIRMDLNITSAGREFIMVLNEPGFIVHLTREEEEDEDEWKQTEAMFRKEYYLTTWILRSTIVSDTVHIMQDKWFCSMLHCCHMTVITFIISIFSFKCNKWIWRCSM